MKTLKYNIILAFFGVFLFSACNSGDTEQQAAEQTEIEQTPLEPADVNEEVAAAKYTCPMHPEVVSTEPGKCPKCGMFLEKVEAGEHQHQEGDQH